MLAQRAARQDRAGVGLQSDPFAIHFQGEPFGGRGLAGGGGVQQQLGGGKNRFQAWGQAAQLRVQGGQARGFVRGFFDGAAQGLGNGAQNVQQAHAVRQDGLQRRQERFGQHAPGDAGTGRAKARLGAFQGFAVLRHGGLGQLPHGLAQAAAVLRDVGNFFHFQQLANAQGPAGELVQPLQAGQIHAAGKLRQGGGGQVVGLVQHQQAVVQLGQQACAQGGQQQVVIDDDDLGGDQFLAPLVVAAALERRAMPPGAGAAFGGHGAPGFGGGGRVQAVAVAVPAALGQGLGHAGVELLLGLAFGLGHRLGWQGFAK